MLRDASGSKVKRGSELRSGAAVEFNYGHRLLVYNPRVLRRFARIVLMLLLVAAVPAQGFASATGRCDAGALDGTVPVVSGYDVDAPAHPGHDGGNHTNLDADAHCAAGVVITSVTVALMPPPPPSGGVAHAAVAAPPGFVPDGLDRPPLTFLS